MSSRPHRYGGGAFHRAEALSGDHADVTRALVLCAELTATPWPTTWVVRSPDALRALPQMKRAANGDSRD